MDRRDFLKGAAAAAAVAVIPGCGLNTKSLRTVDVYDKGLWVDTPWTGLKADHIFRLRDPDGTISDEGTEHEISIATSDAQWVALPGSGKDNWVVSCEKASIIDTSHPCAGRIKVYDTDACKTNKVINETLQGRFGTGISAAHGTRTCSRTTPTSSASTSSA